MNKIRNLLFFILSVILLTYTFFIGIKNIFRYNKLKVQYEKVVMKYQTELQKKEEYKIQIDQMKFQDFWELQAKQKLGYVKQKEIVYKLAIKR